MNSILTLERFCYGPDGTFGKFIFPSGLEMMTVECPWLGNKRSQSCIPDGVYEMRKRHSPVVQRTSVESYHEGWEVTDVPERSYIMIHPGNWPHNFEGCIGVGSNYRILRDNKNVDRNAVTESQKTFNKFMKEMEQSDVWELFVGPFLMEYP